MRVLHAAKKPTSPLYRRAVREFVKKMGGSWAVIEAISKETRKEHEESLFDNTPVSSRDPVLARSGDRDDEDPKKAF